MMINTVLRTAAVSTFEELCFVLPTDELSAEQADAAPDTDVEVAFSGPCRGRLRLQLSGGLLPELAANMLGAADVPAAALQRDAAAELANVICGNVLPVVLGDVRVFRLAAPRVQQAPGPFKGGADRVVLGVGSGRLELSLEIDEAP